MFDKQIQPVKNLWHSLPHQAQACLILFGSTVTTALGDAAVAAGGGFWHWAALKHTLGAAVGAGIVAVRAFYLRPGPGRQSGPAYEGS